MIQILASLVAFVIFPTASASFNLRNLNGESLEEIAGN